VAPAVLLVHKVYSSLLSLTRVTSFIDQYFFIIRCGCNFARACPVMRIDVCDKSRSKEKDKSIPGAESSALSGFRRPRFLIPLLLVIYLYYYPLLLESIFLFTSFIRSSVDIGF
jgi:hypothetical protein